MVRMVKLRMGKMKILDKVSARKTFVHPDTDETVSDRETYPPNGASTRHFPHFHPRDE